MNDVGGILLSLLVGLLLGALFFGGLWWTVHKGVASERPELWFLGSLLLRTGLLLAGFYFVSQGEWSRLLASLVGFLIARVIIVKRLSRTPTEGWTPVVEETSHAP